jgi:hypothetical protein
MPERREHPRRGNMNEPTTHTLDVGAAGFGTLSGHFPDRTLRRRIRLSDFDGRSLERDLPASRPGGDPHGRPVEGVVGILGPVPSEHDHEDLVDAVRRERRLDGRHAPRACSASTRCTTVSSAIRRTQSPTV